MMNRDDWLAHHRKIENRFIVGIVLAGLIPLVALVLYWMVR